MQKVRLNFTNFNFNHSSSTALDSSGGFFNPILASALTLNCQGNNIIQHIFVYWLGSLAGGMIARTLYMVLRGEDSHEKGE